MLKMLSQFDPNKDTWIVADLKSKLEIQQQLFKKYKVLPEESVLRASELWQHQYKRLGGNLQIVSSSFVKIFLMEQLEMEKESWLRVPGAHQTLLEYIRQLFPLLIYQNSEELIGPWWQENSGSLMRWGRWFFYARKYVHLFLENKWILPNWLPYILYNEHLGSVMWHKRLFIDLGSQLTQSEALLFKEISMNAETFLIYPNKIAKGEYKTIDRTYSRILNEKSINEVKEVPTEPENLTLKRFSTALAEVKDLSAQVRIWLQQGMEPQDIAIFAPDIEYYWPAIASYFEVENIPVQKSVVARLQSFLPIMSWLSRLKLELGQVSSEDLELDVFSSDSASSRISYHDFKKLYSMILEDQHLHRLKAISERYQQNFNPKELIYRDEFLLWAMNFYNEGLSASLLEPLLRAAVHESLHNVKLKASSWLAYLENLCAQIEIVLKEEDVNGVSIENFRSARHIPAKCVYVLGLSETQLKSNKAMGIKPGEVFSIESDLGFILDLPENQDLEFDADILLSSAYQKVIASFAETNFSGGPQAASMLWLKSIKKQNLNYTQVNNPQVSLWDFQQQKVSELKNNESLRAEFIDRDLGRHKFLNQPLKIERLSVSRLQSYAQCPFVFLAESIFKLKDPEVLDLDLDAMALGQFIHKVFQKIVKEPFVNIWTEESLKLIFEECRSELKLHTYDERTWFRIQAMVLKIVDNFLSFENQWRKEFPLTHTIGKEVAIKAFWDIEKSDFVSESENGISFSGSIDRVDSDSEKHAVILDYKTSISQVFNFSSWQEKDHLQLSVYSYLLEQGLTELKKLDVLGMGYFVAKDCERGKGLWCEEGEGRLFPINKRSKNSMPKKELYKHWAEVKTRVAEIVSQISTGEFSPKPKDIKNCNQCSWSKICRAPHLN